MQVSEKNTCLIYLDDLTSTMQETIRNALAEFGPEALATAAKGTFVLPDGTDVSVEINEKIHWVRDHLF